MNAIWKYAVEAADTFEVAMPGGARVLCVDVQHDEPFMWVLVDPGEASVVRRFMFMGPAIRSRMMVARTSAAFSFSAAGLSGIYSSSTRADGRGAA
jgi:hypothetical protein